mgnify:CR=1 FL=1
MNSGDAQELILLREWREPVPTTRRIAVVAGAALYHAAVYAGFVAAVKLADGRTECLAHPGQLVGYQGDSHAPSLLLFGHNGLHLCPV